MTARIGRYVLHDVIASGGMAAVHIGRMLGPVGFTRTVAIKRLHPHLARDPEFVAMFLDEARLAARIHHPNVVSTLDVVASDGELFLVLEYVLGDSLSQLLRLSREKGERPPPAVIASILTGMLYGLHAAHEARDEQGERLGLVHRDVSPQNVLVGEDGCARVVDFGVAKAASRIQSTREGQLKGKLSYMSPEQIQREPVDRRADVYAAGAVLWEALAGRKLFVADDAAAIAAAVLEGRVPRLSGLVAELPQALDPIVQRALDADPARRFATALDLAAALECVLPPAPQREVAAWVRRVAGTTIDERRRAVSLAEQTPSSSGDAEVQKARIEGLHAHPISREEARQLANTTTEMLDASGRPQAKAETSGVTGSGAARDERNRSRLIQGALLLGAAVLGVALYALRNNRPATSTSTTTAPMASAATAPKEEPSATSPANPATEPQPEANPALTRGGPPARRPYARPSSPHAPPAPPAVPASAAAGTSAGCDPNFTVDLQGVKRFKPWCL